MFVKLVFYQNAGEEYGGILTDEPCIVKFVRLDEIESFRMGDSENYSVVLMKNGKEYYIPDHYAAHLSSFFDALAPVPGYRTRNGEEK